ncbi:MAG: hypothetical protein KUG64_10235 [Cycloclasticus sp.]|nr:hypothetical protein [Cycloclasticus sp.]
MNKALPYIIIAGFIILFVQGFFDAPDGVSEEDVLYRIALDRYLQEKKKDLKTINEQDFKIATYENLYDSLKNDNSIDTATANQLQSALSSYADSRR